MDTDITIKSKTNLRLAISLGVIIVVTIPALLFVVGGRHSKTSQLASVAAIEPTVIFNAGGNNANLGGRDGADARCAAAKPSSIVKDHVRAFLSVSPTDEIRDMPNTYSIRSDAPIVSPNGSLLANNWADVLDGTINMTLVQAGVGGQRGWWSGSNPDGSKSSACSGWTGGFDYGMRGASNRTTNSWITNGAGQCGITQDLLCLAFNNAPLAPSTLAFSKTNFSDAAGPRGFFDDAISVTLFNDRFVRSSGTLIQGTEYTLSGSSLPSGVSLNVTIHSDQDLTLTLSGSATQAISVSGIVLALTNAAFQSGAAPADGTNSTALAINPGGLPSLTFSGLNFNENQLNDGSISNSIVVTLRNSRFVPDDTFNRRFVLGSDYTVSGTPIPTGLTLSLSLNTDTEVKISLLGKAQRHEQLHDVTGITVTFLNGAFARDAGPVDGTNTTQLMVDFLNAYIPGTMILYSPPQTYQGNLGGRSGIDALCASTKPSTVVQKNVRGFISISATDEIRDMQLNYDVPMGADVRSTTGAVIGVNWFDLLNHDIMVPLVNAGIMTSSDRWWSGSNPGGGLQAGSNCQGWTSSLFEGNGMWGDPTVTQGPWISSLQSSCNSPFRVLCLGFDYEVTPEKIKDPDQFDSGS